MKIFKLLAIICICTPLAAGTVCAKDLKGQVGVGFNSQLSEGGMDSISAKYWLNNDLGFQGIFGFTFSDDVDEVDLGGKVLYKLIDEKNMYVAGIGGIGISHVNPDKGDDDTGWWLSGGVGVEYFFSGLPNLGFSTEIGLVFSDYRDNSSFNTAGDTAISAGIHYYFGGSKLKSTSE
ncbi:MAG: hypothetical protein LJE94_16155 [Deltaproteobacteria bacterium]|nr:hypothetical protein [Deltaproteobacteria bacterium]